jgi:hypothetical protein
LVGDDARAAPGRFSASGKIYRGFWIGEVPILPTLEGVLRRRIPGWLGDRSGEGEAKMVENLRDHGWFGEVGQDAHAAATASADEDIDRMDPLEQIGPRQPAL